MLTPLRVLILLLVTAATVGWQQWTFPAMIYAQLGQSGQRELANGARFRLSEEHSFPTQLAQAALNRAGLVVRYNASYKKIPFPGGDVPENTGCNADEIIRAYRAVGVDLQELVYLDMTRNYGAYPRPKDWTEPDTSMDHRLVANLQVFFKRKGVVVPLSRDADDYRPGDIVTCTLPDGRAHIVLVVPAPGSGRPWILHNNGYGPRIEDRLFDFTLTGHFRFHPRT